MASSMQLTMNAGMMGDGAGHYGSLGGKMETVRADLKSECARVLGNLNGGAGHEQHNAVMREIDRRIDEHLASLNQAKSGLTNASDTASLTSRQMQTNLGSTAI